MLHQWCNNRFYEQNTKKYYLKMQQQNIQNLNNTNDFDFITNDFNEVDNELLYENENLENNENTENIITNTFKVGTWNANGLMRKLATLTERIVELDLDWVFVCESQMEDRLRDPPNSISNARGMQRHYGRAHYGSVIIHNPSRKPTNMEILHIGLYGTFQLWRWKGTLFVGVYCPPGNSGDFGDDPFDAIEQAIVAHQKPGEPIILLGDFNARIGQNSGDTIMNEWGVALLRRMRLNRWAFARHAAGPEGQKYTFRATTADGMRHSVVDYIIHSRDNVTTDEVCADYHEQASDHVMLYSTITTRTIYESPTEPRAGMHWKVGKLQQESIRRMMAGNFQDVHRPQLERILLQETMYSQVECDHVYGYVKEAIIANADTVLGRSRGIRPIHPFVGQELRDAQATFRSLSRAIDANIHLADDADMEIMRRALQEEMGKMKEAAQGSIMQGYYEYVDKVDHMESHLLSKALARAKRSRTRRKTGMLECTETALHSYMEFYRGQFSRVENAIDYEYERTESPFLGWEDDAWSSISPGLVTETISMMATGKAPGSSHICNELLKYCGPALGGCLAMFYNKCLKSGFVPSEWREARIVPIPKVPGSRRISDHRPISLTDVLRKTFERCILEPLRRVIEPLDLAQGGFRVHRGTTETIASLNESILQFERRKHRSPILLFLDIKAAYDSVDHKLLFSKLKRRNCPEYLLRIVEQLMSGIKSRIVVGGVESDEFEHEAGVLQGSIISPLLYSLYIDDLAENIRQATLSRNNVFMYADDVAVMLERPEYIEGTTLALERHSRLNNYRFNPRKCEIMGTNERMTIYGENVTRCTTFKYLGCMMNCKGIRWHLHIRRLIDKTLNMLVGLVGIELVLLQPREHWECLNLLE